MKRPLIPEDVRRFVMTAVPSVPYLEAMLLMRRSTLQSWGAAELAQALYMSEKAAAALLEELGQAGLVKSTAENAGRVSYAPSLALAGLIDRLAEAYAADLIGVSTLIHAS